MQQVKQRRELLSKTREFYKCYFDAHDLLLELQFKEQSLVDDLGLNLNTTSSLCRIHQNFQLEFANFENQEAQSN
ncbi:hypothetical protein TrispH2_011406 [Trichoplax sp. H2]|nr:hypothetical protein TrispH2_011406 [Trichoplax sp. H2]|eukprot:RDD36419.1 hypothetical protein TrispH2_011406 [Trichoplax sp. H2]